MAMAITMADMTPCTRLLHPPRGLVENSCSKGKAPCSCIRSSMWASCTCLLGVLGLWEPLSWGTHAGLASSLDTVVKLLCAFWLVAAWLTRFNSWGFTILLQILLLNVLKLCNFWLVTKITTGWCYRHLVYTLKLTTYLFWCMGTGEARPSSQELWFFCDHNSGSDSPWLDIGHKWAIIYSLLVVKVIFLSGSVWCDHDSELSWLIQWLPALIRILLELSCTYSKNVIRFDMYQVWFDLCIER